ncbi:MAG: hypothetical protein JWP74_922 [Marmoricola sp.]|nr:hypothetical protein [Marmoricola sp.]
MDALNNIAAAPLRHAHCEHCEHEIVLAPRVGWIEIFPGDTYDLCPDNETGRHQPDQQRDFDRPYWSR